MKHFAFYLLGSLLSVAHPFAISAQKAPKTQRVQARPPIDGGPVHPQPLTPNQLFAGEWEWASGGEVFHLTLTRNPAYASPEYPNLPLRDVVIGQFVYTRNGAVVDRSLSTGRVPFAAFGGAVDNQKMEMQFYDHGANRYGYLTLSFSSNNQTTLHWTLVPAETWHSTGPFLVPLTMTLTRQ